MNLKEREINAHYTGLWEEFSSGRGTPPRETHCPSHEVESKKKKKPYMPAGPYSSKVFRKER